MAASKSKSSGEWVNQVVRTSDGRLVVRGVDVPTTGGAWKRVLEGKPLPPAAAPVASKGSYVLVPVTNKSKALATAKRAGLVESSKAGPGKK